MAWSIPANVLILPDRLLVQIDEPGSAQVCTGTVVQQGVGPWGPFQSHFKMAYQDQPTPGEDPEVDPMVPGSVHTYTRIVFNRETAQEVELNGEDYYLIHANDVLAFIPDE